MPEHFKLWQRRIVDNYASRLDEISGIDDIDPSKNTLICLPGYSTTHDKRREMNGYMGIAQDMLGGREVRANIISVSYPSTEGEALHIDRFNEDPLHYSSPGAKEFARHVLLPLIKSGKDVNILAKSYGADFYKMSINELRRLGYSQSHGHIRFVVTGNIAPLNYPAAKDAGSSSDDATEIYIEGSNDPKAARLNPYKESPPPGHQRLTIVPISPHVLQVFADTPDHVFHWDMSTEKFGLRETQDPERHTTRMHTVLAGGSPAAPLLWRVVRNMLTLKGAEFTTETALQPCASLASIRHDIGHNEGAHHANVSYHIGKALKKGKQSREIKAVLFDWDLTLADGEEVNLNALNATFKAMKEAGYDSPEYNSLNRQKMRQVFIGTVPAFFQQAYGTHGELAVEKAISTFRQFRAERRSEIKLLPGAKELLRQLQKSGIAMGIVSNKDSDELRVLKNMLLPEDEFSQIAVIGKESGRNGKPSPEAINSALKVLDLPLSLAPSILFVGDQIHSDITAAINAGCRPCLIGNDDKELLFANSRVCLEGEKDGDYAILLNDAGQRVLYVKNLTALAGYLKSLEPSRTTDPQMHATLR